MVKVTSCSKKYFFIFFCFFVFLSPHSGRTDSNGGHKCSAESKARDLCSSYHYHRGELISNQQKASSKKYNRANWKHWIDQDGDCQNERAEILIYYSEIPVKFKTPKKCVVKSGKWFGVYTSKYYYLATDLDIDHIVPLKEAYLSGGKNWSKARKKEFANDHENLLPVKKSVNRKKGAKDPSQWLPSYFICEYIDKWQAVKDKYELAIDNREKNQLKKQKKKCNQENDGGDYISGSSNKNRDN